MPREYTKKSRASGASRPSSQPRVPGWVWLFTGAVLGAFVMFLMRLANLPTIPSTATPETQVSAPQPSEIEEEQPRFDFYNLLKETEVPIPEVATETPEEVVEDSAQYLLQVASFKGADDAEQLRAELILMNLDAHVEKAKVRNGEIWHRVLVGPFDSRSKLAKARSVLASNRLEALILKRADNG